MKANMKKYKKMWIAFGIVFLLGAVVWAAVELSGQANAMAQDAGSNSAELESVSVQMIKKPKSAPKCNWTLEKELKKKIEDNDAKYTQSLSKAKNETRSGGKVSEPTKKEVLSLAAEFKRLNDQYADLWNACNCRTRAKLATEAGNTRMKSADVVVSEIDQKKLDAMKVAQDNLKLARQEYASEAKTKGEISPEDKKDIRATVVPRVDKMVQVMMGMVQNVQGLVGQVQKAVQDVKGAGKGNVLGALSAAKTASDMPNLLTKVQTLFSVAQAMLSNADRKSVV